MKWQNACIALNHVIMTTSLIPMTPFQISTRNVQAGKLNAINNVDNGITNNQEKNSDRRIFVENAGKAASIVGLMQILSPQNALSADSDDGSKNESELKKYEDLESGFEVSIPESWIKNEQNLSDLDRRKLVLYVDPNSSTSSTNSKTLLFIAYSSVPFDYTSLGSFGSVDQVAQATVLPKGQGSGAYGDEGVDSKLITAKAANNAYYFDYTITPEKLDKIHFRSIFYLSTGSTGANKLVTITVQTPETEYLKRKDTFDKVISSFGMVKKA